FIELSIVIESQFGVEVAQQCDALFRRIGIVIEPVTVEQAHLARQAFHDFGKGRHAAGLNFGDCFAYALAKLTGETLLFKGNDFKNADIVPALCCTSLLKDDRIGAPATCKTGSTGFDKLLRTGSLAIQVSTRRLRSILGRTLTAIRSCRAGLSAGLFPWIWPTEPFFPESWVFNRGLLLGDQTLHELSHREAHADDPRMG